MSQGFAYDVDKILADNLLELKTDLETQIAAVSGGGDPEVITQLQDDVAAIETAMAELNVDVANKAEQSDLVSGLAVKANTTDVNSQLGAKADTSAVNAALLLKADATALTSGLAGKVSQSTYDAFVTATNNALAAKATTAALTALDSATDTRLDSAETRLNSIEAKPSGIQYPKARGAVAFTFDDGWSTHPYVADQMAQRGQAGTFYVTADLLGTSQHMASSEVTAIAGYGIGHEIGCHSKTHVDMTTLNATTRDEQWASKATIEALLPGGKKITSYAYPLGNNNLACNQEAYGRFDRVAAIGLSQGYYTGSSGYAPWLYDQEFEGFRHGRFNWSSSTHAQLMSLLKDHVRRRPVVLTVYTHQLDSGDSPTTTQFLEAVNYCQATGIPCLTTADALPGPKVINPGFEDGLNGWNVVPSNTAPALAAVVDVITDTAAPGLAGTKSLRLQTANMTSADSVHVFQLIPVKGDTGYSASARIRHDGTPTGAGKFSIRINEYDSMGAGITGTSRSVRGTASTSSWAQSSATPPVDAATYVLAGRTRSETRYMTVGLYIQEYSGTFYADHVHFGPTEDGLLG